MLPAKSGDQATASAIRALFKTAGSRSRRHQITEVYEKMFAEKIQNTLKNALRDDPERPAWLVKHGEHEDDHDNDNDVEEEKTSADEQEKKSRSKQLQAWRMKVRRRVVGAMWAGETEGVKAEVLKELEEESLWWEKMREDAGSERSPAQYQS